MIVARVTNAAGIPFNVRLVRRGDRYGLNDCLTHDKDDPMVEFYDARVEDDPRFVLGRGQFVSRYYWRTLTGEDGWSDDMRDGKSGLTLLGHVPDWTLTGANVREALAAVGKELER